MKNILLQTGQMTPHLNILHCPDRIKDKNIKFKYNKDCKTDNWQST
jgi:hypothetical protein